MKPGANQGGAVRILRTGAILALAVWLAAPAAAERVLVRVSLSEQLMRVHHEGRLIHTWPVSTGKAPKRTPVGRYVPQSLAAAHRSSIYGNAPMPWSIFFRGNYAIHGTTDLARLGQPASHGCVRLHPDHAKILFRMVRAEGLRATLVLIGK